MSAKINKLLIKVNGVPAGHITTRKTHDGGTRYSFNYLPDAGPEQALSLTMPVRDESYATWQMPPALEMSLPEGLLKDNLVRRFGKLVSMDPMGLLWITGRSRVGNISAELPADNSNDELLELDRTLRQQQQQQAVKDIEAITSVTDDELETLFEGLLQDYATGSGVSGMQPKVLAKTLVQSKDNPQRALFKTATHIIKTSENDLPYLALNEHLCLRVAALSGLDVPRRVVSDNGEVIILKRFDLRRSGGRYYVEDGCVLQGRTADNRYEGSMENLVAAVLRTIAGRAKQNTGRQLYALTAVNTLVRNGDAHLKNFSILYEHPDNVKLAKGL